MNGYWKSKSAWRSNSRVKSLMMYVDGKPYAKLLLLDSREVQEIPFPIVMLDKQRVLRFEIVEVFAGARYQDTAITELVFDGVGVH